MKSKRMSLYIVSVVLLVIMIVGSLGVATWALLSTKLDVSGNIGFQGTGDVLATISKGECTGGTVTQKDGKTPMQQVDITATGPSDSTSWADLELVIADKTEPLVISFSVTNNQPEGGKNLEINVDAGTATVNNITITVTTTEFGATKPVVIAPGAIVHYNIACIIGETNTILTRDFELVYNLTNTDAQASVDPTAPTLDKLKFTLNADKASYSVDCKDAEISGAVIIPEQYNGLPVTIVGYKANAAIPSITGMSFCGCSSITSVVIPPSVTYIARYCFEACFNLELITFQKTSGTIQIIDLCSDRSSTVKVDLSGRTWTSGSTCYTSSVDEAILLAGKTWTIS